MSPIARPSFLTDATLAPITPSPPPPKADPTADTKAAEHPHPNEVQRVLERRLPTDEELERLMDSSRRFYEEAMEKKRRRWWVRVGVCAVVVLGGVWLVSRRWEGRGWGW